MLLTAVQNGFDKCLLQKHQLVCEMALLARLRETRGLGWLKDGNGSGLGRISMGFGFCGFGFEDGFSPTVFGFGPPKPIGFGFGFGFPPVDIQWISEINHLELNSCFIIY